MQDKICYIFGAGDLYVDEVEISPGSLIIAADGGLYHTKKLGIEPDIFLGDFDSADRSDAGKNCVVFPSKKDYTDMFLAVEYGKEHGYTRFELYGGLGGKRIEHTLANLQMLAFYTQKGLSLRLHGNQTVITDYFNDPAVTGKACVQIDFDASHHGYLSLFASCGQVSDVTLTGLKYPLSSAVLTPDFPLGVSNEFIGEAAHIEFSKGTLIVVYPEKQLHEKQ